MKSAPVSPSHVTTVTCTPKPRAKRATLRPLPPAVVKLSTDRAVSPQTRRDTTTVWSIAGLGHTHTNRTILSLTLLRLQSDMSINEQTHATRTACCMVAFDHRSSLDRDLDRIGAASGPARRAELKLMIWQSVQEVLPRLPARARAAVLVDRGHGRIVKEAIGAAVTVATALEASGHRRLTPDAAPADLLRDLRATDGGLGKVLVRWLADDSALDRRRQLAELRKLDDLVAEAGAGLLLELLIPPAADEVAGPGSRQCWEETVLPGRQRAAVEEILESGVTPPVWKIEGHPDAHAAGALSAVVGSARHDASILVLGGGAEIGDLRRVFSCGAHDSRFSGFAVGRSIWWKPTAALCRGDITETSARRTIGDNFLAVIDAFDSATRTSSRTAPNGRPAPEEPDRKSRACG